MCVWARTQYERAAASKLIQFHSVQSLSLVWLFATPWIAVHRSSLSITNSWSLLKHMSIKSVMPSNRLILSGPLLLPLIFSSTKLFSNELILHISGLALQSELVFSKSEVSSGWDLEMVYCHFLLIHLAKKKPFFFFFSPLLEFWAKKERQKSDSLKKNWRLNFNMG